MSIRTVDCAKCKGRGVTERLQERGSDGNWHDWNATDAATFAAFAPLADEWIRREGERAPVRWIDADCPRCGGDGAYQVEYTTAKIF